MLARNYSKTNKNSTLVSGDLQQLEWVQTVNPAGLSTREKHTFWVILAALRRNETAVSIKIPLGELASLVRRHTGIGSPATVRRALAGLQSKGFLWRRRCRLGNDRLGLELLINRERWAYWTQTSAGKVSPITAPKPPTSVYIPPRQSMGAGEDRTISQSTVNTCNININSSYARARGNNYFYNFLSRHPVMLTLWCLLKGSPDMSLFNRAETEVKAIEAGLTPDNLSGVPWEDYERNWKDMIPAVRESFTATQILPKLRGEESPAPAPESYSPPPVPLNESPATEEERNEIRRLIEESLASTSLPAPSAPADYSNIDMENEQMKVLLEAMARARARCVD